MHHSQCSYGCSCRVVKTTGFVLVCWLVFFSGHGICNVAKQIQYTTINVQCSFQPVMSVLLPPFLMFFYLTLIERFSAWENGNPNCSNFLTKTVVWFGGITNMYYQCLILHGSKGPCWWMLLVITLIMFVGIAIGFLKGNIIGRQNVLPWSLIGFVEIG